MTDEETATFFVILVEPKYGGNIGAVARVMMNFGFNHLILVNPCKLDQECYSRAMHAQEILDTATIVTSFEKAVDDLDFLVATSSIENTGEKKHLREAIAVEDFAEKIGDVKGKIGLVFGREDYGLFNEEIARCDIMVKIPTSDRYPSLNLSHSVGIILYSLSIRKMGTKQKKRQMGHVEKEKLYEFFSTLLEEVSYPKHKREHTKIMFKRLLGRAMPSTLEYHTLMGVLSKTLQRLQKTKKN